MDAERIDDKRNFITWADVPALISMMAVLFTVLVSFCTVSVFVLSCMNIWSIYRTLGFDATHYLDFIDYVQSVPTLSGTVAGLLAFPVGLCILSILVVFGIFALVNPKGAIQFAREISVLLFVIVVGCMVAVFYSTWQTGNTPKETVLKMKPSTVVRKGGPPPIKGVLFLHSSRYMFLWVSDDNSVVAIPNVEVQMIKTPSNLQLPYGRPTLINPSPTATAIPSPTSSTSPKPSP